MAFNKKIYDIFVDQFDYGANLNFNLTNSDKTKFDLTGYAAQFIVKENREDEDINAIVDESPTVLDNILRVSLSEKLTFSEPGDYFYAIRLKGDGYVNTIVQGKIIIKNNTFESAM